jgi:hypothetical protein
VGPSRRYVAVAVALLTVAGLLLRGYGLHTRGIWWDEAALWAEALGITRNPYEAPLDTWLVRLTMHLANRADSFVLHVPAALVGTLTIPAAFWLGRTVAGVACGLGTALLVTVAPVAVYFAGEARPYALVMLLTTLQLAAALALVESWMPRRFAALLALTAAAVATHLLAVAFSLGLGVALVGTLLWRARDRPTRTAWLRRAVVVVAGGAAALAVGAAWTLFRPSLKPVMAGRYAFGPFELGRYALAHLTTFAIDTADTPQPLGERDAIAAIFAVAAVAGVVTLVRRRQLARAAVLLAPLLALLAGLYLQLGEKSTWPWVRYATPLLIPLLALAATAVTAPRRPWIALPLTLALAAVNLRDGTGLPAWAEDAPNDRGWQYRYSARRIAELESQLRGVIFVQQRSIYGDETDRMTVSYTLPRSDHLPMYWEHDRALYRVRTRPGPGGAVVPLRSDDGPLTLPPGDYAVFDGWVKLGCAAFSPHLAPSPLSPPPDVIFLFCRWR